MCVFITCLVAVTNTWQSLLKEGKVYFGPQLKGSSILAEKGRWQAWAWHCWVCSQEEGTYIFLDLTSLFLLCSLGPQLMDLCCSQSDWVFQSHFNMPRCLSSSNSKSCKSHCRHYQIVPPPLPYCMEEPTQITCSRPTDPSSTIQGGKHKHT